MAEDLRLSEAVRIALLDLYDPAALAETPLLADLAARGVVLTPRALAERLLEAIAQLRPPEPAPLQAHGWRCFRYLQLRYVECRRHAEIAQDLAISLRQASRVHQDALQMLARALVPEVALPAIAVPDHPSPSSPPSIPGASWEPRRKVARPRSASEEELEMTASLPREGGVQLGSVIQGAGEIFSHLAAARQLSFDSRLSPDLPTVRINRVALRQIVLQLMVHLAGIARDRLADRPLVIQLDAAPSGESVVLECRLVGARALGQADWPHEMGDPSSREPSPLTAARSLARMQGASIDGAEWDDRGVALRLRISIDDAYEILLIDDNPDVGRLFRRMLAGSAYQITQVRTATRALAGLRENPPRIIILDIVMPTRDGWEVLTALKGDPGTRRIPVIVCSVLPDRELALSLGANDFLAKPVIRSTLLAALDQVSGEG